MQILSVGVYLFHAERGKDRKTDMTETIVALRNFAHVPKKGQVKESLLNQKRDFIQIVSEAKIHDNILHNLVQQN